MVFGLYCLFGGVHEVDIGRNGRGEGAASTVPLFIEFGGDEKFVGWTLGDILGCLFSTRSFGSFVCAVSLWRGLWRR